MKYGFAGLIVGTMIVCTVGGRYYAATQLPVMSRGLEWPRVFVADQEHKFGTVLIFCPDSWKVVSKSPNRLTFQYKSFSGSISVEDAGWKGWPDFIRRTSDSSAQSIVSFVGTEIGTSRLIEYPYHFITTSSGRLMNHGFVGAKYCNNKSILLVATPANPKVLVQQDFEEVSSCASILLRTATVYPPRRKRSASVQPGIINP
jgi:hypothetical protein